MIQSVLPFERIVSILGKILKIDFKLETTGYYEEFPTYYAKKESLSYAILAQDPKTNNDSDLYQIHITSSESKFDLNKLKADLKTNNLRVLDD